MCDNGNTCPHLFNLYISADLGKTWSRILTWVSQAQWDLKTNMDIKQNGGYGYMAPHKNRILATHYTKPDGVECSWSDVR